MAAAKKTAPKKKAAPAGKKAAAAKKKTAAPAAAKKKGAAPAAVAAKKQTPPAAAKKKAAPAPAKRKTAAPAPAAAKKKAAPAPAAAKKTAAPAAAKAVRKTTHHRDKLILKPEPLVEHDRLRLLRDGERFGTGQLALHQVGQLALTSGEIVTVDPFLVDGAPLTRKVAPGSYPVTLSVATFNDPKGNHDQRVAAATVRFRDGQPARWEVATFAGAPNKKGGEPGYPVDAGTGSFLDAATQAVIQAEPPAWPTPSFKALEKQLLTDNYRHTWGWANYQPDPASPGNCIAFSAGWGDGVFASYWGLDEAGEPVCLLTDFETFTDEDWTVAPA